MQDKKVKIETRKRGNSFGFWFFKLLVRTTGLKGAYGFLYIVCFYYLLFDKEAVKAAGSYIDRRFPLAKNIQRYLHIYRLFISQGRQLIDRHAAISGIKTFDMRLKGYQELISLVKDRKEGLVFLTAHMGNWQIAMTALGRLNKKVYLVMRPEDNPAVSDHLRISEEQGNVSIISVKESLEGVFKIIEVLKQGNIVCIMGDRHYGFDNIDISFLGEKARFPCGAFVIAASLNCPVVALLSVKLSTCGYDVDATNVFYPKYAGQHDKSGQIRQWVQGFADILGQYVDKYPYQCFLFHNVWS